MSTMHGEENYSPMQPKEDNVPRISLPPLKKNNHLNHVVPNNEEHRVTRVTPVGPEPRQRRGDVIAPTRPVSGPSRPREVRQIVVELVASDAEVVEGEALVDRVVEEDDEETREQEGEGDDQVRDFLGIENERGVSVFFSLR